WAGIAGLPDRRDGCTPATGRPAAWGSALSWSVPATSISHECAGSDAAVICARCCRFTPPMPPVMASTRVLALGRVSGLSIRKTGRLGMVLSLVCSGFLQQPLAKLLCPLGQAGQ